MGLNDLLFIFFKHKRMILRSAVLGVIAALAVYFFSPPPYESQSKLLVRYVLDRSMVDPQESQVKTLDANYNDNLIAAEKEILSSWDLATQVTEFLSAEGFLPESNFDQDKAARNFLLGLSVTGSKGSNVLSVSFKNRDPRIAQRALEELINRYFVKHLEVHRSAIAFDYVTKETALVQARLKQIEAELKGAKEKAGIISLKESTESMSAQIAKSQEALNAAEEARVSQRARVMELERQLGGSNMNQTSPAGMQVNKKDLRTYQVLALGVATLRQKELDLLSRFTAESQMVKTNQAQIGTMEDRQRELESKFPGLIAAIPERGLSLFDRNPQLDLISERAGLAASEEKARTLRDQFHSIQERAALFSEMAPQIAMLERKKELEEVNYKYFQASLDKARIDEALDPRKIPNISIVQKPSPAMRAKGDRSKILLGLAGGGVILGLTLAMLMELVFDRTLKRSVELESLNIPKIISIPDFADPDRLRTSDHEGGPYPPDPLFPRKTPWEERLRPYGEALRDRLSLYFQLKNMNRKPKLVALTGCSQGAGTSTIAGALAAAFSETGEGKVLFVNMKAGDEDIHPLFDGNTAYPLSDAFEPNRLKAVGRGNLYLATANSLAPDSAQMIPKRFYDLIPHIKGSDFEYIIFDMPPLGPTSSTLAMAGFMDKVLLVVEAEVSSLDSVKRAYAELVAARADVSAILNKSRSYGPKSLQCEI